MARIMVVDDAAFLRMMLKNILAQLGHEIVAEAANGEEAIRTYKQFKPDLVTMDITMPDMDGIKVVEEIISFDPHAKIIMCSAMGSQNMVLDAIKVGAKDFIVKPFQNNRVMEAVTKVLG
ncbi:response regulator with CheY-like receiver, AAA-type ATPase, and DNA-binding domains [Thermobacillus composti KWC4]|uniref:Response regulator with CheY-like receiver, AAA-type ATPase, and DNA-binding domains n=1 Tax=Thermobacillus composti (strain DSM 18247 / JCM 13945 / KWC4) TaxID=717605 RepID=L0EBC3_THECK|nr:response regulator [Thermobacillus composti]AGA56919.1 response regulator with CheY-like receiver, AAA-type ATPase, and DNA-binding domains [Thermobacillus composti KWC4]